MTLEFKVLTAQEVAKTLRVSRATVTRLAQRGDLSSVNVPGRLLFTQSALEKFLETPREKGERR